MTGRIIDELFGAKDIDKLVSLVGLTIGLNLIIHLISTGLDHLRTMLRSIMIQNQDMKMNEKIINMDYEHIENPKTHNLRTKIAESENFNGGGVIALLNHLKTLIKGLATVIISIVLVVELFRPNMIGESAYFINTRLFSYGFLALVILGTIINLNYSSYKLLVYSISESYSSIFYL